MSTDFIGPKLPCCGSGGPCDRLDAVTYRQRTAYANEDSNWTTLCPDCAKWNNECWDEMWRDYYSDKL